MLAFFRHAAASTAPYDIPYATVDAMLADASHTCCYAMAVFAAATMLMLVTPRATSSMLTCHDAAAALRRYAYTRHAAAMLTPCAVIVAAIRCLPCYMILLHVIAGRFVSEPIFNEICLMPCRHAMPPAPLLRYAMPLCRACFMMPICCAICH